MKALILGLLVSAAPQGDRLDDAFAVVREAVDKGEVPGAIVLVARRGAAAREEFLGFRDVEQRLPFAGDTLCWIASITKPVTAAAVMKLVEEGKVGLDDPVEKHLPEFKEQKGVDGAHHPFTIRQLLVHRSGILPVLPRWYTWDKEWLSQTVADVVKDTSQTRLLFAPGDKFSYSNPGFFVLGRVVEQVTGKAYADYVRETILDPLAMKDAHYLLPAAAKDRVALLYREENGKRFVRHRYDPQVPARITPPDGGLYTTPRELLKFLRLFVENNGRVLAKGSVEEMLKKHAAGDPGTHRGLGWLIEEDGSFRHGGSSGTMAWADAKTGTIGILFCQIQYSGRDQPVSRLHTKFLASLRKACGGD